MRTILVTGAQQHIHQLREFVDIHRPQDKPGITGWAQVNGYRGETDTIEKMRRRIECDLFYIGHLEQCRFRRVIGYQCR